MKRKGFLTITLSAVAACGALLLAAPDYAAAHCDTLDGPVVKDARQALAKGDITPVLKWVKDKDEQKVRKAFALAQAAAGKGGNKREAAEHHFFETLVKVHRAGEGAPFTGLKPAGTVEPAVAEADRALATGSPETLEKMVADAVSAGIHERFARVAEAVRHKDESIDEGRKFVEAYVEYTHYVERLHQDAVGQAHGSEGGHDQHHQTGHGKGDNHAKH
jgi:hypothetical protein